MSRSHNRNRATRRMVQWRVQKASQGETYQDRSGKHLGLIRTGKEAGMADEHSKSTATTTDNSRLMESHMGADPKGAPHHKTEEPEPAPEPASNTTKDHGGYAPKGQDNYSKIFRDPSPLQAGRGLSRMGPWKSALGMRLIMEDVAAFHRGCDVRIAGKLEIPDESTERLRIKLIEEEVLKELIPALHKRDLPEIADGIGDAIVVLVGTALSYGIPLDLVWAEIDRSNMAKIDPVTGKVIKREDGKVLKPAGWSPPDIAGCIGFPINTPTAGQ